MKKLITISLILFLLTGCCKTIICKTKEGNVEEEYNIKYSGNDITKLSIKKTYKFDDVESFENFENTINYTVLSLKQNNIQTSYKKKNKKYILKQVYNIKNTNEEELKQYGLSKNKEELLNNLKNNGLICK